MIDFDTLVLGPAYAVFGVTAQVVLAGTAALELELTVQDNTTGIQVTFSSGRAQVVSASADLSVAALRPAAAVRRSELTEKSVTPDGLREAAITFNGRAWRIKGHAPKPSPNGEAAGEIFLLLEAAS